MNDKAKYIYCAIGKEIQCTEGPGQGKVDFGQPSAGRMERRVGGSPEPVRRLVG